MPTHVRNAVARFDQVEGVTDTERDEAWRRIQDGGEEVRRGARGEELARALQRGQGRSRSAERRELPGRASSTTTERSTSPRCMRAKASST